jgi:16S rRNA (uracil1498-N3)-methyltransferase
LAIRLIVSTGVKKFFIFRGERSYSKISDSYVERLKEIALNTAEQSEVCIVPKIEYFETIEDLLNSNELKENLFVLSPKGTYSLKDVANATKKNSEITFFVGPEGGFSEEEINTLKNKNAREVAIKSGIFRAQFAGVVAVLTMLELIAQQG